MEQAYHLIQAGRLDEAEKLITNFDYCMAKCRLNRSDDLADEYRILKMEAAKTKFYLSPEFRIWEDFIRTNAHILHRGHDKWSADMILLQIAMEHADDSPITMKAERYLEEGKCDWHWLMDVRRPKKYVTNPCLTVLEGHKSYISSALLLPDGHVISAGGTDLRIWDAETGRCLRVLRGHPKTINKIFLFDESRVISSSDDKTLRVWDTKSGECLQVLTGHTKEIIGYIGISDNLILSWSADQTLRVWDLNSGQCLKVLTGHTHAVSGILSLPNNRILSWCYYDNSMRVWDMANRTCLAVLDGHKEGIQGVLILSAGRILSWSLDSCLRIWDYESGKCLKILEGHSDAVSNSIILTSGNILSWSEDHALRIWNSNSGKCINELTGHTDYIYGVLLLPNDRILSWSGDKSLRIWDANNGKCLKILAGHTMAISDALLHTNGNILSWSLDNTLRIWNRNTWECQAVLAGHTDNVNGAIQLPDERFISWSNDNSLRIWHQENGECLNVLQGHTQGVSGIVLLKDGRILSRSFDNTIRIWDYTGVINADAEPVTQIPTDGALVCSDQLMVSWSSDRLNGWNMANGRLLWHIDADHGDFYSAVPLSGNRLLTWTTDRIYQLWDIEAACCITTFEQEQIADGAVCGLMSNTANLIYRNENCFGSWLWWHGQKVSGISRQGEQPVRTEWHSNEELMPVHLFADGRCIMVANGMHVLQLRYGNQRIGLELIKI